MIEFQAGKIYTMRLWFPALVYKVSEHGVHGINAFGQRIDWNHQGFCYESNEPTTLDLVSEGWTGDPVHIGPVIPKFIERIESGGEIVWTKRQLK